MGNPGSMEPDNKNYIKELVKKQFFFSIKIIYEISTIVKG